MTPTLVRQHVRHAGRVPRVDQRARARDWSEIQERMLVPLYEAVYERLEVGAGTRLLGLGCGSGLALLMAASRGAVVTGVDTCPERLALARRRLQPENWETRARADARLVEGAPEDAGGARRQAYTVVTSFEPLGHGGGDGAETVELLSAAAALAERGAPVVLAGWGPPERCATTQVLQVAGRADGPADGPGHSRAGLRDGLEEVAQRAGLRPDGSGRVACPFGYADVDSAVRGLRSTGLFDAADAASDPAQVDKETAEALEAYRRADGTVWMPNVFRYLVARTR
ncbi:methyltransferase domain-containing protein [Streptomyces tropicalis]|uniref:Methyltransferase domain-containing protein n=1 Tax=Streptomyces tropicalis TaxID=3034234 RepID=A0ABT6ADQ8_9ACTN|nr:methyltransferase domain-containing protein [Streptomyces tropicalis]MDF3302779.1 methyltransferase domain-containing protein [Streptomyces tropicalis]